MSTMPDFEKLGAFYLGKTWDPAARQVRDELLLYDAKDLTTHAVCVGMTGSGKTGLCISLLEEAALDGVPAIAIDPKGDLGNLRLTFPRLRAEDFRPWIDESEARRKGLTPDEYAADRAGLWTRGLAEWGQDGARIDRLRKAADVCIYTPGSDAGRPLTVLRSFAAPPPALREDRDAIRERVAGAVSGLLTLVGGDADPIRSREHILLSRIIDDAWSRGRDLDIGEMIRRIQEPGFDRLGVLDLESFFPAKKRFEMAMALNGLLASPAFQPWMQGEPLDIGRLLYTQDGKPRLSILSIAHLSEAERMFFVTLLLHEVVTWMRTQPGTSSLRALLYMDEVFGFFPPSKNPPAKTPMLTLLKQARAYGVGVVLATQNPVDLDYKGLSNTGTWFLGRLQTERDKMRVMEGLEGAAGSFDRAQMESTLAGLGSRVFLMHNVHEDEPTLFHTRWAMSYLRGPLTRAQIRRLTVEQPAPVAPEVPSAPAAPAAVASAGAEPDLRNAPPPVPSGVQRRFLPVAGAAGADIVYRPALVGVARLHYVRVSAGIDEWQDVALLAMLDEEPPDDPWEEAEDLASAPDMEKKVPDAGRFAPLPPVAAQASRHKRWSKALVDHLYRGRARSVWQCRALKASSELGMEPGEFRVQLREQLRERRDMAVEKLRRRYAPKLATLADRIRKAEQRLEKEESQYKQAGFQTVVSIGTTVLGALFGRKLASAGTVGRAGTTLRSAGRTAQQKGDIGRVRDDIGSLRQRAADLEAEFEAEMEETESLADADAVELKEIVIAPRKSDMVVRTMALAWLPYRIGPGGFAEPAYTI